MTTEQTYELTWLIPDHVMHLRLNGMVSLHNLKEINALVTEGLSQSDAPMAMVIDVSNSTGFAGAVEEIRATQRYGQHPNLKSIIVMGKNKLMRLTLVIIFNVATASLKFCQNIDEAHALLKQRGYIV